ncbi:ABC transporter ATP-binding protein [Marinitoga sp. 38H-ov]|uniref:ABC transporter ATP-binding protein n=1 Tax=Marinitoga sp. 38H-ov TaxID=1755814 RepID=UPI0013EAD4AA|nr:ABC transporter ATP-binding protein [Marinitoga sp. 38H-ov]KAF2955422.1 hypothetical protein AS160_10370 [Marinitoga sp. 38H-ov]
MECLIEVRNLTFGYEDIPILKNFNLKVNNGEILLIEGDNGVGKTTLLKCIGAILNGGKNVYFEGKHLLEHKDLIKNISFVLSEDTLYEYLTVGENIKFYKNLFNENHNYDAKIKEYIELFGIEQYYDVLVKNLSQGTRNKLYLAIMMSKNFKALVLDEPFTALDKMTQEKIISKIKFEAMENNKAVIMVTHIDEFKKIATRRINITKFEC